MTTNLIAEEIYPKIIVYSNVFEDVEKMSRIAKECFMESDEQGLFGKPVQWSIFGDYITDINLQFDTSASEFIIRNNPVITNKLQEDQFYFIKETIKAFFTVNAHYSNKFGINTSNEGLEKNVVDLYGPEPLSPWRVAGPTICKYHENAGSSESKAMRYHSDYIREPMQTPGFKFVITTTSYFNDDYIGGELDFAIDKKLIGYKPKAGDVIVFPSGHPDYLTEDGNVFLHAVQKCTKGEKYFSRMYWTKYEPASQEWNDKVEEFGIDEWKKMYEVIIDDYRKENQQRDFIEGGERIR